MRSFLIVLGLILILIGLAWPWFAKFHLGRLPGDFSFSRPGFHFYFPLTTCLVVSIVITLIIWFFRK